LQGDFGLGPIPLRQSRRRRIEAIGRFPGQKADPPINFQAYTSPSFWLRSPKPCETLRKQVNSCNPCKTTEGSSLILTPCTTTTYALLNRLVCNQEVEGSIPFVSTQAL
jgi:hypothetical protein